MSADAKVTDLDGAAAVDQDITGLNISVHNL